MLARVVLFMSGCYTATSVIQLRDPDQVSLRVDGRDVAQSAIVSRRTSSDGEPLQVFDERAANGAIYEHWLTPARILGEPQVTLLSADGRVVYPDSLAKLADPLDLRFCNSLQARHRKGGHLIGYVLRSAGRFECSDDEPQVRSQLVTPLSNVRSIDVYQHNSGRYWGLLLLPGTISLIAGAGLATRSRDRALGTGLLVIGALFDVTGLVSLILPNRHRKLF